MLCIYLFILKNTTFRIYKGIFLCIDRTSLNRTQNLIKTKFCLNSCQVLVPY